MYPPLPPNKLKKLEDRIKAIKNWYLEGTVPDDVAVYDENVISGIYAKSTSIAKNADMKSFDLLEEIVKDGYDGIEIAEESEIGREHEEAYDYNKDVADQGNYFEYFKANKLVLHWSANDNMSKLPPKEQNRIVKIYKDIYLPLLDEITSDEKKFLHDVLRLSGGAVSAYCPLYDNNLQFDNLTRKVHKEEPLL